jgi:putative FmdB family regulatory protein
MPFYEYECPACKYYAEVMQKITDAPLTKCPSCGKKGLKKLVSAPVFRLKGGGWYETDFKSDKENKRNLHGSDKEESKPEGKEAKPEAKEAKPEAKEAKEAKQGKETTEVKETKPAAAKAGPDAGATARTRISVAAKPNRTAARRPARRSSARSARKHRR